MWLKSAGTEKRRSTEPRNTGRVVLAETADSTCEWREVGAQVTITGVDPSGTNDSSAGFQTALNTLQAMAGGELYIPPGNYTIAKGLTYSGYPLSIIGAGQGVSVLLIPNVITVFSITLPASSFSLTVRDIGLSPLMAKGGGTAFAITGSTSGPTTQTCLIEDVDLSVLQGGYTSFGTGLALINVKRSNIRNVNMHSNVGVFPGGSFASLSGCIDVRFNNCTLDIVDTGFFVAGYSEGIHIIDTVVANTNVGISTGTTPYSGNGTTTPYINLLGLYIDNCEFNCDLTSAVLAFVDTAWISNTHFSSGNVSYPAMSILGSNGVQVSNCGYTGGFNANSPANWVGVMLGRVSGWATSLCSLNNCLFQNLGLGISIQQGAFNTVALGMHLSYQGKLVSNPVIDGAYTVAVYQDVSGNSSNEVQTIGSQFGTGNTSNRVLYSR